MKLFKIILVSIIVLLFASYADAVTRMYGRVLLTGGTTSVDNIAYANLNDGDLCVVIDSYKILYYY